MTEVVNLRAARKRAKRQQDEARARDNRLANGQPKYLRQIEAAKRAKNYRELERHLIKKKKRRKPDELTRCQTLDCGCRS